MQRAGLIRGLRDQLVASLPRMCSPGAIEKAMRSAKKKL